jgi:multiple sugar transport system substrate-binding protein
VARKALRELTRRDFAKVAASGALSVAVSGPFFLFPERAQAEQKTLRILQWSHFVPAYDQWFDNVFAKKWGEKHDTKVTVDHVTARDVNTRGAAEVAAGKGHDLFLFEFPPAAYEKDVIDLTDLYQEVEKKHGKPIPLAERSSFNPKTKKYFAFADSYVPFPGNFRQDLWSQIGYLKGPDSYDDLRTGAKKIRDKFGNPCGIGLSQDNDTISAVHAILWSFGGSEQDEAGKVTINSKPTIEALKFVRTLYQESETPEVFTWDETSNNRSMLAGRISYTMNAVSISRTAEKNDPAMSKKIWLGPALKGPVRQLSPGNVVNYYVIWRFSQNKEGAKQFLLDLINDFGEAFKASEFYNFPCRARPQSDSRRQIQGAGECDRLDHQYWLSRVRDSGDQRKHQHVCAVHHVRESCPRSDERRRSRTRCGSGIAAHIRSLEMSHTPVPKPMGSFRKRFSQDSRASAAARACRNVCSNWHLCRDTGGHRPGRCC